MLADLADRKCFHLQGRIPAGPGTRLLDLIFLATHFLRELSILLFACRNEHAAADLPPPSGPRVGISPPEDLCQCHWVKIPERFPWNEMGSGQADVFLSLLVASEVVITAPGRRNFMPGGLLGRTHNLKRRYGTDKQI